MTTSQCRCRPRSVVVGPLCRASVSGSSGRDQSPAADRKPVGTKKERTAHRWAPTSGSVSRPRPPPEDRWTAPTRACADRPIWEPSRTRPPVAPRDASARPPDQWLTPRAPGKDRQGTSTLQRGESGPTPTPGTEASPRAGVRRASPGRAGLWVRDARDPAGRPAGERPRWPADRPARSSPPRRGLSPRRARSCGCGPVRPAAARGPDSQPGFPGPSASRGAPSRPTSDPGSS